MKRIAIYCDGTWNRPDADDPTNVYNLFQATQQTALNGTIQLPKYIPGVGTGFGMEGMAAKWDKFRGGVFGAGVTRNIMDAYRFLAEMYQPGDEIYIFGFSRGAFTARSLAGMIRSSGLPRSSESHEVGKALKRYRDSDPDTKPDTDASMRFRASYSPDLATSQDEVDWRVREGLPKPELLTITFLGIWDTVGAMGVPGHYRHLAKLFNGSHGFHDTKLSSSVMAARHAVSIDEARKPFPPTLWDNLEVLNLRDPSIEAFYLQEWFPGDHGSVGGGGDIKGLSNIALRWVAIGAADQGLDFDWVALDALMKDENVMAPLHNSTEKPGFVTRMMRKNKLDRPTEFGPISPWQISSTARARNAQDPRYRPELFGD